MRKKRDCSTFPCHEATGLMLNGNIFIYLYSLKMIGNWFWKTILKRVLNFPLSNIELDFSKLITNAENSIIKQMNVINYLKLIFFWYTLSSWPSPNSRFLLFQLVKFNSFTWKASLVELVISSSIPGFTWKCFQKFKNFTFLWRP